MFDDWPNLNSMRDLGGVHNWYTFLNFVFSGAAGPLGRPVSLLTFLINDHTWPSDPWSFKYTNLMLHLLIGVCLTLFGLQLTEQGQAKQKYRYLIALGAAGVWMIHPIQIATVMLVIQRMTQLETLFTVVGLICFMAGRTRVMAGHRTGWWWLTLGYGVSAALAVLSKESGIMLCAYVWVTSASLAPLPASTAWRSWKWFFVYAPLAALTVYLCFPLHKVVDSYAGRDFTLAERLMTEPRVIVDYMRAIIAPHASAQSVLYDDYIISRNLTTPWQTLPAICLVIGLFVTAIALRKSQPLFAFGALWYLAGHILEGTILPLELYFTHRNYLPLFGPVFATACALSNAGRFRMRNVIWIAAAIYAATLAIFSRVDAGYWGNATKLAIVWGEEHPHSIRAQQFATSAWLDAGQNQRAVGVLYRALDDHPEDMALQLQWTQLSCAMGILTPEKLNWSIERLKHQRFYLAAFDITDHLRQSIAAGICKQMTLDDVLRMSFALEESPDINFGKAGRFVQMLWWDRGKTYIALRDLDGAMNALDTAYAALPHAYIAIEQSQILLSAGLPEDAKRYAKLANVTSPQTFWQKLFGIKPAVQLEN